MLIPYRVKNPPKRFPIATVAIIAINVIVYAATTEHGLIIKEAIVKNYSYQLGTSSLLNMVSAAFLHGGPMHLIGNMLFFWVFGPPVEDRLGIPKFLGVYFLTGFAGDILQAVIDLAVLGDVRPCIGASGCIMGILGAYWFIYSWSTVCVAYFFWIFVFIRYGVWEVAAFWIIGLYVLMDVFEGLISGAAASAGMSGGVANFAHVGGAVAGALLCLLLRIRRDTSELSEAKAIQSDMKDFNSMPLHMLQTMLKEDPKNLEILRATVRAGFGSSTPWVIEEAMAGAGIELIDIDPSFVAYYLLTLHGKPDIYHSGHLLYLAGKLERGPEPGQAIHIYWMVFNRDNSAAEAETALYRAAMCYWNVFQDLAGAQNCLREMGKRFPNGPMLVYGKNLWNRIKQDIKV